MRQVRVSGPNESDVLSPADWSNVYISTSCSIIKIVELWICPMFVKHLNLDQNNSAGDMPRTSVLGRLDCSLPRVGVLIELSVSHISYRQRLLQHQD